MGFLGIGQIRAGRLKVLMESDGADFREVIRTGIKDEMLGVVGCEGGFRVGVGLV